MPNLFSQAASACMGDVTNVSPSEGVVIASCINSEYRSEVTIVLEREGSRVASATKIAKAASRTCFKVSIHTSTAKQLFTLSTPVPAPQAVNAIHVRSAKSASTDFLTNVSSHIFVTISMAVDRCTALPAAGSSPSTRYPTSSKNRLASPRDRISDKLLRSLIGTFSVGSSELSTPQRVRKSVYDS